MNIPRADENSKEFFRSILPDDPRITIRPMFGNISAFVNGNMFTGLFGDDLFVRVSEESRKELLEKEGSFIARTDEGKADERIRRNTENLAEPTRDGAIVGHPVPGLDKPVASQENQKIAHLHLVE